MLYTLITAVILQLKNCILAMVSISLIVEANGYNLQYDNNPSPHYRIMVAACCYFFFAVIPSVFVLVPFIVDMANGHDDTNDIIVQRAKTKEEIS